MDNKQQNKLEKHKELKYVYYGEESSVQKFLKRVKYEDIIKIVGLSKGIGIFYLKDTVKTILQSTPEERKLKKQKREIEDIKNTRIKFIESCLDILRSNINELTENRYLSKGFLNYIENNESKDLLFIKKKGDKKKYEHTNLSKYLYCMRNLYSNTFEIDNRFEYNFELKRIYNCNKAEKEDWEIIKHCLLFIKKYAPMYLIKRYGKILEWIICEKCGLKILNVGVYCSNCGGKICDA